MSEGCMERANDKARSREVRVLKPACRRQEDLDKLTDKNLGNPAPLSIQAGLLL